MIARGFLLGAAVAAGGLLLVPGVAAAVAKAGRPLARAAMRTGATAFVEFRKAGAEVYEHLEDMAAEIRAEMAEEGEQETRGGADATGSPAAPGGPPS